MKKPSFTYAVRHLPAAMIDMLPPCSLLAAPNSSTEKDPIQVVSNAMEAPDQEDAFGHRAAAFFDLDKTIIATNSAYAYGREFFNNGLITPTIALRLAIARYLFMVSGQSQEQMDAARDQITALITGWDAAKVQRIVADALHTIMMPTIYEEARELITCHKQLGHDVIIISVSSRELVEPIAYELGVTATVTTELEIIDGVYTGNVVFYCKGQAKADAVSRLAAENGYDLARCFAYSDSATDIPMLTKVGTAVAVNPDKALKKHAKAHGWEILSFKNPIPLFQMPSKKKMGIGGGVIAGVTAAVVGGLWLNKRLRNAA